MDFLEQATLFLLATVILVPLFKRLGLGAVLGYLAAGILIGPFGLGMVDDVDQILHFAELGVVLLLFIIGLELQPKRLWVMRKSIIGLGGMQVLATTAVLIPIGLALGLSSIEALVVGFILSLSSTAFALQLLGEKRELTTRHGRAAFSILLFQDMAVIPALALIPLAAGRIDSQAFSPWDIGKVIAVIGAVVLGGRYVLYHVFRWIAQTHIHEVFTAMALLTVVGTALLMEVAGLSMALGAFLAGVLLAESEYRHALEADIDPFKGILLGLFFISVGMSLNVDLMHGKWQQVLALVTGLLVVKFAVLSALGRMGGLGWSYSLRLAGVLPQGGEFAFVLLGSAVVAGLIAKPLSDLLVLVVTLSMAATPLIYLAVDRLLRSGKEEARFDDIQPEADQQVIIAGFGRVGQIVARILRAKRIPFTALDISSEHVDLIRRFGNKIYYGDASRLDMLRAANAEEAALFVLAIDDVETSIRTARLVREHFPRLKILARARNRKHAYRLMDIGDIAVCREVFYSSLKMAEGVLKALGIREHEAQKAVSTFEKHDVERLRRDHDSHTDEEKMMYLARKSAQELEELFDKDLGS